jgi:hypothetical protein
MEKAALENSHRKICPQPFSNRSEISDPQFLLAELEI